MEYVQILHKLYLYQLLQALQQQLTEDVN